MDAQQLENECGFRLKFASLYGNDDWMHDCLEEYETFPSEAPPGWAVRPVGHIQTRFDHERRSWIFSNAAHDIAAVEHETGVEILIAVGVNVGSAAIVGFATWAWARWRNARRDKPPSTLVVERVEERLPDGGERILRRVLIRSATEDDIAKVLTSIST